MIVVDLRNLKPRDQMDRVPRTLLFPALAPLSILYGALVGLWRRLPGKAIDVGIPVVSIGSILVGGTGKTPLCMLAAQMLARSGRRVCVISRGYMRKGKQSPLKVSNGHSLLVSVAEAGDEPYLIARRLQGVSVVVGKDRVAAARAAISAFKPDVFILDDGFQARGIAKCLDVVTFDGASLRSRQALLPLGRLREPWDAIRPEHVAVVVLEPGEPKPSDRARGRLPRTVFFAALEDPVLMDADGCAQSADSVKGLPVLVLSGIAQPARFERTCIRAGVQPLVSIRFGDHHWYDEGDAVRVSALMHRHGCKRLVTTEKDFGKLPQSLRDAALAVRADITIDNAQAFEAVLQGGIGG